MPLTLIILGMAVVTALPRIVPILLPQKITLPDWAEFWLASIPYAALGALIFPGILTVEPGQPWIGLAGGGAAVICARRRLPLGLTLAAAVMTVVIAKAVLSS